MEPLQPPMGPQKSRKSPKVPPKGALFTPRKKRLRFHRFSDPPEPSKTSWRLHKTSIFTFWPCPQNGIKSGSQNLPFRHLWAPKSPKVQKMRAQENTLKNTSAKIPKMCQNDLRNCLQFGRQTLLFASLFPDLVPRVPQTLKISDFSSKKHTFLIYVALVLASDFPKKGHNSTLFSNVSRLLFLG